MWPLLSRGKLLNQTLCSCTWVKKKSRQRLRIDVICECCFSRSYTTNWFVYSVKKKTAGDGKDVNYFMFGGPIYKHVEMEPGFAKHICVLGLIHILHAFVNVMSNGSPITLCRLGPNNALWQRIYTPFIIWGETYTNKHGVQVFVWKGDSGKEWMWYVSVVFWRSYTKHWFAYSVQKKLLRQRTC